LVPATDNPAHLLLEEGGWLSNRVPPLAARRRCKFEHVYGDSTYRWNLNPLCKEGSGYEYSGTKALGQQFFFNICGNTSVSCSDYSKRVPEYESHGAATQFFQVSRGTRNNGGCLRQDNTSCTDYTFGGDTCCSVRRCEVVAYNIFTFDVLSRTDPSAGVVLTYAGYPDRNDDDFGCPEQAPGLKRLRSVVLTLQCDPAGAANDLQITDYNEESPYCTFRVTARTRAACGVADAPAQASQRSHPRRRHAASTLRHSERECVQGT
jgi:hypothetical protein